MSAADAIPAIRPARDTDADGLIALINACWSEYPGCMLDVDGELPELRRIATYISGRDGRFWVAERDGRIVASAGVVPAQDRRGMELLKLYVDSSARRRGLAARLVAMAEEEARGRGADKIELWSDTRFLDAHRLYRRLGYTQSPGSRTLQDLSNSVEFHFAKALGP